MLFELATYSAAIELIVLSAVGIYALVQRARGKPAPTWLPFLNWFIKPDKTRLDRLVTAFARA